MSKDYKGEFEFALKMFCYCRNKYRIKGTPKRIWDGKTAFTRGIAKVEKAFGTSYVCCRYNPDTDVDISIIYDPDPNSAAITKVVSVRVLDGSEIKLKVDEDAFDDKDISIGQFADNDIVDKKLESPLKVLSGKAWDDKLNAMTVNPDTVNKPVVDVIKDYPFIVKGIENIKQAKAWIKAKGGYCHHLVSNEDKIKEIISKMVNK